jgi:hypothetical protein
MELLYRLEPLWHGLKSSVAHDRGPNITASATRSCGRWPRRCGGDEAIFKPFENAPAHPGNFRG